MKYIRNYNSYKSHRSNTSNENNENYFYNKGRKSNKSILECALISEGISYNDILLLNESVNFNKVDNLIVDSLYESIKSNDTNSIELLEEGVWGNLIDGAKDLWDKGVQVGKTVFKSFKDFLARIGDIIKTLFGKIKQFFQKLWEIFIPKAIELTSKVADGVKGAGSQGMSGLSSILGNESTQSEIQEAEKDLTKVREKFSSGNVGNMSDEAAKKLEDDADEYKDVTDTSEIEELIKDSFNSKFDRKTTVRKVYYSLKGYLLEGNNITELYNAINEADEVEYKEGDVVKYKTKAGDEVEKEIIKIDGDKFYFKDKEGNEFTKTKDDIISKAEQKEGEDTGGVKSGKGMFGWICEGVGFILSPISKLKEWIIKAGVNGAMGGVSAFARGFNSAYKYVVIGTMCSLVYHIIHGITSVWGHLSHDSHGGHAAQGTEGGEEGAQEGAQGGAQIAKESYIFEASATLPKIPNLDPSKKTLLGDLIKDSSKILIPITGGLILKALGLFSPTLTLILEIIIISIGVFELIGAVCELNDKFKDKPICKLQHKAHHFLSGGGGH